MKTQLLFSIICLAFLKVLNGQVTPSIEWQKCLGGTNNEAAFASGLTNDGGYIVAGYSDSNDGDVTGNNGSSDFWVVRLDPTSDIQWQNSLGGTSIDEAHSVQQTIDDGFIVAGFTYSTNIDVTGNHGSSDFWIVKLATDGSLSWQKTFGGSSDDGANSIQQTVDDGFIIAGYSSSNDGDVSGNHGMWDYWIVKTDSSGNLEWQKSFGGSNNDVAYHIEQTIDGGYIVSGYSESSDGDVTGNNGARDYWILKLDSGGELVWQTHLGSSGYDEAYAVTQDANNNYVVSGFAGANDFDVSGNHGAYDFWVVKLDSSGSMLSQKCFGGTSNDQAFSLDKTKDGGYVTAGQSQSTNGDVTDNHGSYDCWVVKMDTDLNLEWEKSLGGSIDDYGPYNIHQTLDEGYFLGGSSTSNDDDVSGNHGGFVYGDAWVVKLVGSKATGIASSVYPVVTVYPNPAKDELYVTTSMRTNDCTFNVYDVNGKAINLPFTAQENKFHLSTRKLPGGIYTLQILDNETGFLQSVKFVKDE